MSYEPLPRSLEQGVNRFAQQHHISRDEALRELVATGLGQLGEGTPTEADGQRSLVQDALRKVEAVRAERAKELAALSVWDQEVGSLVGFLENEPEVVEAIRQANRERRRAMYGS